MADEVRKQSKAMTEMSRPWPMIDALLGGTQKMREAGKAYLPQWPNEDANFYKQRLDTATLLPAFQRTIDVLSAKPFSKPLTIGEDVPARFAPWLEDIDLQGRNLHAFSADILEEALSHGLSGILVEYPRAEGVRTQAEEAAAGIRPYFIHIHPGQILGWRAECKAGVWQFTQLRILETVCVPDGEFGEKEIEQVRVLTPGAWQVYRKTDPVGGTEQWAVFEEGTTTLNLIPFVPVYGQRKGFMKARPPLLDLAYQNVEHWQSKSDQQTILHVARVPILLLTGFPDDTTVTIGASTAVRTASADANMKYVEHGGQAIGAGKESLLSLEDQMRQTGAELLVIKPGNTSIPQTMADNEPGKCALQRIVEDVEDALDTALDIMAKWVGEPDGGHVDIFDDFGAATLAEASADMLLKANIAGKISDETFFAEIQRRGLIGDDVTWDEEQERIAEQKPPLGSLPAVEPQDDPVAAALKQLQQVE